MVSSILKEGTNRKESNFHIKAIANYIFLGKNTFWFLLVCICCHFGPLCLKVSIHTLIFESRRNQLLPSTSVTSTVNIKVLEKKRKQKEYREPDCCFLPEISTVFFGTV